MLAPDPDLNRASTPEAGFYTDPERYRDELGRVLPGSWQYVGHAAQLARPGDFLTAGAGGEPLLLVNDAGTLRGFINVCRHRAGPLAYGCGNAPRIVCRYHGWTYDLAGQLQRAPEMEGALDFRPADVHLAPVQVHRLGPLLFAAVDARTPPFDQLYPGVAEACARFRLQDMRFVLRRDYPVAANWKIYVENFLEGYHLPTVHPGLSREIDYRSYVTELAPRHVLQHAPVRAGSARLYSQAEGEPNASYYWLHPNHMLNLYERQLQLNVVTPTAIDACSVRFEWFALAGGEELADQAEFQRLLAFSETVQEEDATICAALQANVRSSAYRPGRYSPRRESGVHLFHRLMLGGR